MEGFQCHGVCLLFEAEKGCVDRVVSNFLRSLAEARYGEFVVAFNFKFNFV